MLELLPKATLKVHTHHAMAPHLATAK